jgi:hypothetical protein
VIATAGYDLELGGEDLDSEDSGIDGIVSYTVRCPKCGAVTPMPGPQS